MTNPWLQIPLSDYEAHMALPHVRQAQLLSDVFGCVLDRYAPRSAALLGSAGGNGLEQAVTRRIERVVAVDINPTYIAHLSARWGSRIAGLEAVVADIANDDLCFEPVDLVFTGLLLEYVDAAAALPNIRSVIRPGGTLVTVIQLPSVVTAPVTPSPFTSLAALSAIMHLVPPDRLRALAEVHGLMAIDERTIQTESGKQFCVQSFFACEART
jgi:SAM-dependent methyltransferase